MRPKLLRFRDSYLMLMPEPIPYFHLPYFHVSNGALLFYSALVFSFYIDVILTLSILLI